MTNNWGEQINACMSNYSPKNIKHVEKQTNKQKLQITRNSQVGHHLLPPPKKMKCKTKQQSYIIIPESATINKKYYLYHHRKTAFPNKS